MIRYLAPYARLIRFYSAKWQRRAIFLLGGIAVGAASVGLAMAADEAQSQFRHLLAVSRFAPLIVTPAGFALSIFLTLRFFPNSQGSGIPQVIAARQFKDQESRSRLVSARIAVGKVLLTLLGLLCGASTGREGPTVQVGASLMFLAGRFSPKRQPGLILAGAAAGVAAAFNAPLAGIVFGIEEISRSFEIRASGLVLGTVIAGGLVSQALVGSYTYFGTSAAILHDWHDWIALPVCAVAGGIFGGVFSRILIAFARGLPGKLGAAIKRNPILFAAVCGFLVAVCGLVSGETTYGTGYVEVKSILAGGGTLPHQFGIAKLAATVLSSISGIPGGIFSPSIAVGAGLGMNIAELMPSVPLDALILLGMVSYFAGVVQAPVTAFVIVTEMTDNQGMIVPLMTAALIASAVSRLICREGVYHALSRNYLR